MAKQKTFEPYDPMKIAEQAKVQIPQVVLDALEKLKFPYKNLK